MESEWGNNGGDAAAFRQLLIQRFVEDAAADKRLIREVLHRMGLRGTLIRVRLVALLLMAGEAGSQLAVIHARLEGDSGMPLRTLNTYEVLRRLTRMGVLSASRRGTYAVSEAALALIGGLLAEQGAPAPLEKS